MVDVQVGIARQPIHEQVDHLLEGALLAGQRHRAVRVARPETMERRTALGIQETRLDDAEEIVEAVVEGEGIALHVEEQIAG